MKKITLLLTLFVLSLTHAQVGISEDFNAGTPDGWTDTYQNNATDACEGNTERGNLYASSNSGNLTSPNFAAGSNGTDLTISFDYKIEDWNSQNAAGSGWGTAELQYSTDDGGVWTTVLIIDDNNHVIANTCATMMAVIPAASLPTGSDVKLRIFNTWVSGDYDFHVDNFNATQVVSNPPNCDALLTETTDVSIDGEISWSSATGIPTGYFVTAGTTSGGTDLADNVDNGALTTFSLGVLLENTTYFVTITPYNDNGSATGCAEQTFITKTYIPGEICEVAIDVTLPYSEATGTTAGFGDDYAGSPGASGCGTTSSYLNGDDIVYSYTATSDTQISIDLDPVGTWSGVFVYTNCSDIGTSCVAGVGSSNSDIREIDLDVINGTTYYIVISTFASPQTVDYALDIFENPCTDATVTYAVVSDCDVSGGFVIDVEITDLGTASTLLVSNDQNADTFTVTVAETVQFGPFVNATDVIITVDDQDDDDDSCTIASEAQTQVGCPPANDECDAAIALTVNADTDCAEITSATTQFATASAQPDDATGTPNTDVWFTFVATAVNNNIVISNVVNQGGGTSTSTDMGMSVFDAAAGCNMTDVNEVGESDPDTLSLSGLTIGNTYYVRVYGWSSSIQYNNFDICIGTPLAPPSNDECSGAIVLNTSSGPTCENAVSGTTQSATPSGSGCTGGRDVWYSFTAVVDGNYIASETETFDSGFSSTYISAYEGSCGGLTQIGSSTSCFFSGDLIIPTVAGNTYFVNIRSSSSSSYVEFDLCLYLEPTCFVPEDLAAAFVAPNSADLSWVTPTDGTVPSDYNWEVVPQGNAQGDGAVSSGTTTDLFATATGLTLDTLYDLRVQSNCGTGDLSSWSAPFSFNAGYCIPSGTNTNTYIDNFSTTGGAVNISNLTSGLTTGNYENNSGTMSVSQASNGTFDFEVDIVSGTVGCAVWVDWNNDFIFDVSEVSFSTTSYGSGPFTGTVTIPDATPDGNYRMRVMIDWNDSNPGDDAPCSFGSGRGETEDYTVTVDATLSVDDVENQSAFTYFPNPVKNTLTLNAQNEIDNITVINMLGQEVLRTSPNTINSVIDMSSLQTGIYFVRVTINSVLQTVRVIKQ
ncbi:T9SS type A sorting domain-containing protein [Psychroserpens burtonensis]|uniref:T9SS type A sorting domain-containing protein n=1 Tax=Psychroserpens burtonensis TaxID=49278 RepID=A0A5C7B7B0_9FLAO|nr:GEVED domain-containing protein [Psychroserpens burtonensis]TXE17452.1 T9SS type A sorting domain-containing protein [Psychroserpens burtonensis]